MVFKVSCISLCNPLRCCNFQIEVDGWNLVYKWTVYSTLEIGISQEL